MNKLIILAALLLPACTKTVTVEKPKIVYVEVRAPCPNSAQLAILNQSKPVSLRDQKMPDSAVERVAQIVAQLGLYEAPGAYVDQVDAVLKRCEKK